MSDWPSDAGFNPSPQGARFIAIPQWLLSVPGLSKEGAVAYGVLLSYWRIERRCNPSIETLARRLHVDRRNVKRQLRQLERLGLIAVHPRVQDGRQQSNAYSFRPHPAFTTRGGVAPGNAVAESSPGTESSPGARVAVGGGDDVQISPDTGGDAAPQLRSQRRSQKEQKRDADAPLCSAGVDDAPSESLRVLESRYDAALVHSARESCALARKSGKVADGVWLRVLRQLAAHPIAAVEFAMREFTEKHADGDKAEAYLVAIARRKAANGHSNGHGRRGPALASAAEAFAGMKDDFDAN